MFTHIVWDFDGTLFDTYPMLTNAMLVALSEFGIVESEENILRLMKVSMSHMMKVLEETYQLGEKFYTTCNPKGKEFKEDPITPFPGAIEICRYISDHQGYNHLFTHRDNSAITYLEEFELLHHFTGLITRENGFARKPSPEAINFLIKEYDISKDQALLIGDREIDLMAAKNAGIRACHFNPNHDSTLACADYTIQNFNELETIISR